MAKDKKEKPVLNLDDKEYIIEDMTDEQKTILNHVRDLSNKIESMQFNLNQLNVGKEAFVGLLRDSLKPEPEITGVEA